MKSIVTIVVLAVAMLLSITGPHIVRLEAARHAPPPHPPVNCTHEIDCWKNEACGQPNCSCTCKNQTCRPECYDGPPSPSPIAPPCTTQYESVYVKPINYG
ncbi:hypothetical protein STAS_27767 [Striga asiatica]|uniref:Uncharacterized protein n=1 Tax=Striga asiatica TaxID=4170 RepID=A0A5A7QZD9_STRAF|nr:hypothetical protein STAS_27767 [Striga asiatica]